MKSNKRLTPARLRQAVALFNVSAWYACHEELERLWRNEERPERDVYKGVLQIGVAMYHAERKNYRGARRLLRRAITLLEPYVPSCMGMELQHLVVQARAALEAVENDRVPDVVPRIKQKNEKEV